MIEKKEGKKMVDNDRNRVKELLEQQIGRLEIHSITRMGGLTNRTYKVETTDGIYVVRIPGEGTEEIIVPR